MGERLNGLSIRDCRLDDVEAVLELWRRAEATPGVTDTADDLRRAVAASAACVLVAEVEGQVVGSIIGTFDGWRGNLYRLAVHPDRRRQGGGPCAGGRGGEVAGPLGGEAHHCPG